MNEALYFLASVVVIIGLVSLFCHVAFPREVRWDEMDDGIAPPEQDMQTRFRMAAHDWEKR